MRPSGRLISDQTDHILQEFQFDGVYAGTSLAGQSIGRKPHRQPKRRVLWPSCFTPPLVDEPTAAAPSTTAPSHLALSDKYLLYQRLRGTEPPVVLRLPLSDVSNVQSRWIEAGGAKVSKVTISFASGREPLVIRGLKNPQEVIDAVDKWQKETPHHVGSRQPDSQPEAAESKGDDVLDPSPVPVTIRTPNTDNAPPGATPGSSAKRSAARVLFTDSHGGSPNTRPSAASSCGSMTLLSPFARSPAQHFTGAAAVARELRMVSPSRSRVAAHPASPAASEDPQPAAVAHVSASAAASRTASPLDHSGAAPPLPSPPRAPSDSFAESAALSAPHVLSSSQRGTPTTFPPAATGLTSTAGDPAIVWPSRHSPPGPRAGTASPSLFVAGGSPPPMAEDSVMMGTSSQYTPQGSPQRLYRRAGASTPPTAEDSVTGGASVQLSPPQASPQKHDYTADPDAAAGELYVAASLTSHLAEAKQPQLQRRSVTVFTPAPAAPSPAAARTPLGQGGASGTPESLSAEVAAEVVGLAPPAATGRGLSTRTPRLLASHMLQPQSLYPPAEKQLSREGGHRQVPSGSPLLAPAAQKLAIRSPSAGSFKSAGSDDMVAGASAGATRPVRSRRGMGTGGEGDGADSDSDGDPWQLQVAPAYSNGSSPDRSGVTAVGALGIAAAAATMSAVLTSAASASLGSIGFAATPSLTSAASLTVGSAAAAASVAAAPLTLLGITAAAAMTVVAAAAVTHIRTGSPIQPSLRQIRTNRSAEIQTSTPGSPAAAHSVVTPASPPPLLASGPPSSPGEAHLTAARSESVGSIAYGNAAYGTNSPVASRGFAELTTGHSHVLTSVYPVRQTPAGLSGTLRHELPGCSSAPVPTSDGQRLNEVVPYTRPSFTFAASPPIHSPAAPAPAAAVPFRGSFRASSAAEGATVSVSHAAAGGSDGSRGGSEDACNGAWGSHRTLVDLDAEAGLGPGTHPVSAAWPGSAAPRAATPTCGLDPAAAVPEPAQYAYAAAPPEEEAFPVLLFSGGPGGMPPLGEERTAAAEHAGDARLQAAVTEPARTSAHAFYAAAATAPYPRGQPSPGASHPVGFRGDIVAPYVVDGGELRPLPGMPSAPPSISTAALPHHLSQSPSMYRWQSSRWQQHHPTARELFRGDDGAFYVRVDSQGVPLPVVPVSRAAVAHQQQQQSELPAHAADPYQYGRAFGPVAEVPWQGAAASSSPVPAGSANRSVASPGWRRRPVQLTESPVRVLYSVHAAFTGNEGARSPQLGPCGGGGSGGDIPNTPPTCESAAQTEAPAVEPAVQGEALAVESSVQTQFGTRGGRSGSRSDGSGRSDAAAGGAEAEAVVPGTVSDRGQIAVKAGGFDSRAASVGSSPSTSSGRAPSSGADDGAGRWRAAPSLADSTLQPVFSLGSSPRDAHTEAATAAYAGATAAEPMPDADVTVAQRTAAAHFSVTQAMRDFGYTAAQPTAAAGCSADQPIPEVEASAAQPIAVAGFTTAQPVPEVEASAAQPIAVAGFTTAQPVPEVEASAAQPIGDAGFATAQPVPEVEASAAQPIADAGFTTAQPVPEAEASAAQPIGDAGFATAQPMADAGYSTTEPMPEPEAEASATAPMAGAHDWYMSSPTACDLRSSFDLVATNAVVGGVRRSEGNTPSSSCYMPASHSCSSRPSEQHSSVGGAHFVASPAEGLLAHPYASPRALHAAHRSTCSEAPASPTSSTSQGEERVCLLDDTVPRSGADLRNLFSGRGGFGAAAASSSTVTQGSEEEAATREPAPEPDPYVPMLPFMDAAPLQPRNLEADLEGCRRSSSSKNSGSSGHSSSGDRSSESDPASTSDSENGLEASSGLYSHIESEASTSGQEVEGAEGEHLGGEGGSFRDVSPARRVSEEATESSWPSSHGAPQRHVMSGGYDSDTSVPGRQEGLGFLAPGPARTDTEDADSRQHLLSPGAGFSAEPPPSALRLLPRSLSGEASSVSVHLPRTTEGGRLEASTAAAQQLSLATLATDTTDDMVWLLGAAEGSPSGDATEASSSAPASPRIPPPPLSGQTTPSRSRAPTVGGAAGRLSRRSSTGSCGGSLRPQGGVCEALAAHLPGGDVSPLGSAHGIQLAEQGHWDDVASLPSGAGRTASAGACSGETSGSSAAAAAAARTTVSKPGSDSSSSLEQEAGRFAATGAARMAAAGAADPGSTDRSRTPSSRADTGTSSRGVTRSGGNSQTPLLSPDLSDISSGAYAGGYGYDSPREASPPSCAQDAPALHSGSTASRSTAEGESLPGSPAGGPSLRGSVAASLYPQGDDLFHNPLYGTPSKGQEARPDGALSLAQSIIMLPMMPYIEGHFYAGRHGDGEDDDDAASSSTSSPGLQSYATSQPSMSSEAPVTGGSARRRREREPSAAAHYSPSGLGQLRRRHSGSASEAGRTDPLTDGSGRPTDDGGLREGAGSAGLHDSDGTGVRATGGSSSSSQDSAWGVVPQPSKRARTRMPDAPRFPLHSFPSAPAWAATQEQPVPKPQAGIRRHHSVAAPPLASPLMVLNPTYAQSAAVSEAGGSSRAQSPTKARGRSRALDFSPRAEQSEGGATAADARAPVGAITRTAAEGSAVGDEAEGYDSNLAMALVDGGEPTGGHIVTGYATPKQHPQVQALQGTAFPWSGGSFQGSPSSQQAAQAASLLRHANDAVDFARDAVQRGDGQWLSRVTATLQAVQAALDALRQF